MLSRVSVKTLAGSLDDDLRCAACEGAAAGHGALLLGLDPGNDVLTVQNVFIVCADECALKLRDRARSGVLLRLRTLAEDPFTHLDKTLSKYDWDRGTVERFVRVLSRIRRQ